MINNSEKNKRKCHFTEAKGKDGKRMVNNVKATEKLRYFIFPRLASNLKKKTKQNTLLVSTILNDNFYE